MSRSLWKPSLLENNTLLQKNFIYKIFNRNQQITPNFLKFTVKIYNGNRFFEILIDERMLGHRFGEFAPTRKIPLHKKKKRKNK